MAAQATDVGTASTVTFGTSSWSFEMNDLSWSGMERNFIDSSHLGTTVARTFLLGDLYDPGALTIQGHLDTNATGNPILVNALETVTLTFPNTETYSGSGGLQSHEISVPLEDKMTVTAVVKFSGAITFSVGA